MKKTLTLLMAGIPEPREATVEPAVADAVVAAFRAQDCTTIPMDDGSVLHLNTRQVAGIAVEDADEDTPTDDQTEADADDTPPQKMIPDPDPNADPDRTVAQLKEALDAAKVEYPGDARKADLQQLATEHGV